MTIREAKAAALGGGVFRITAKVENTGFIPTATQMARKLGRARPVTVALGVQAGVEVLSGKPEMAVGHLEGQAEPVVVEWLVRVKAGSPTVTIAASSMNGGRDEAQVALR